MSSLKNTCFQNNLRAETALGEFAISLVLVILCEAIKVETESRNFSALEVQRVFECISVPILVPTCIGTSPF